MPTAANGHKPASFLQGILGNSQDPARGIAGMPPNFGRYPVGHIGTFQGYVTTVANIYRDYDEAIKHSLDNARYMRNDCGIMECLEARQRATALLGWHLEPEDEDSQEQKDLCDALTKILTKIRRFTEYRYNLLHALWYGRYGIQHRYGYQTIGGHSRILPTPERENPGWLPINGDKLCFRFAGERLRDGQLPHQLGIRVGVGHKPGDKIGGHTIEQLAEKTEATDRGLAYFLTDFERKLVSVHKHSIEDGAFEDPLSAGMIHGVGIRSRIYWDWVQKQESLGFLIEYLERSAGGIELWRYPDGNPKAKQETEEAATQRVGGRRNILLVPMPAGEEALQYGVEVIEPGMAGIEAVKDLLTTFFGHRIKRYILGQVLSSEAEATGLGSGVADLHLETFLQIVRYDATNLEETITDDLLRNLQLWNFPASRNISVRFRIDTEKTDQKDRLAAYEAAWNMGARIKESDVFEVIGAAPPEQTDNILENPQIAAGHAQAEAMRQAGQNGMPGGRAQVSVPVDIGMMGQVTNALAARGGDGLSMRDDYSREGAPERYGYVSRDPDLRAAIEHAAIETETAPSDSQRQSGNYRKGRFHLHGMEIAIETPRDGVRSGKNRIGVEWSRVMPNHYGYIRRTESEADGDHVDVFVGPDPESELVFVVDQQTDGGRFDEHKVMLGFTTERAARDAYRAAYPPSWRGLRNITGMTVGQFRAWIEDGDTGKPIAGQVSRYAMGHEDGNIQFNWDESKHPRDSGGQFTSGGGGDSATTPAPKHAAAPKGWLSLSHHDAPAPVAASGGATGDFDFAGAFKNARPGDVLVDQLWEGVQKGVPWTLPAGIFEQSVEMGRKAGVIKHRQHVDFLKDNARDPQTAKNALTALWIVHKAQESGVPLMVDQAGSVHHPKGANVASLIPHIREHKTLLADLARRLSTPSKYGRGLFDEDEHPRDASGQFSSKADAPGVPGQQMGLFGHDQSGQGRLFNVETPKTQKRAAPSDDLAGVANARVREILKNRETLSPADKSLQVQPDSLPGQRELTTGHSFEQSVWEAAQRQLDQGETIQFNTMTRVTRIDPSRRASLRFRNGQIQVQRGKAWDNVSFQALDSLAANVGVKKPEYSTDDDPGKKYRDTEEDERTDAAWQRVVERDFSGDFGKALDALDQSGLSVREFVGNYTRDDSCDWITIGSQHSPEHGGNKGGTPVCVSGGKIAKGPKALAGKTLKGLTRQSVGSKRRQAVREAAKAHDIDALELSEMVDALWPEIRRQHQDREDFKRLARERTGLTESDVSRIENDYRDYSTVPGFDDRAAELANNHPQWFGSDNPSETLWELLREGKIEAPAKHDPEVIRAAVERLTSSGPAREAGDDDEPWDEWGDGGSAVPFGRDGDPDRYAYQRAFDWKEDDHPRDAQGRFSEKEGDDELHSSIATLLSSDTLTASDIAEKTGRDRDDVQAALDALVESGKLLKHDRRRDPLYWADPEANHEDGEEPPEEPADEAQSDETEIPDGPDDTPRQTAEANTVETLQNESEYAYARESAVPNAGEDLLGSARHKANAWRSLDEAEENGTAAQFVTRDNLLKNEPHDLMVSADSNPLTALAMHLALKKLPPKPGYGNERQRSRETEEDQRKNRSQYLDAFRRLKGKAESLAKSESDPVKALNAFAEEAKSLISELRGQKSDGYMDKLTAEDPYNATANALVATIKGVRVPAWAKLDQMGRMPKTTVGAQLHQFTKLASEQYGDISDDGASEHVAEHAKDIIEGASIDKAFGVSREGGKRKSGFNASALYVTHATRKGGRDISTDTATANKAVSYMVESLGMRGVQWGNSVTDDERQHHARMAAEAFSDLMDVLGFDQSQASLDGKLGLAIGARGKGNALAHYEPSTHVINLTRKGGVGSLAHEWGHFFDHHIAGSEGDNYGSEKLRHRVVMQRQRESGSIRVSDDADFNRRYPPLEGHEKAVAYAMHDAMESMASSGFRTRLGRALAAKVREGVISDRKARDYWESGREMFARTFERYVQRKLENSGRGNTYLAGLESGAYDDAGLWPTDGEIDSMTPAFDAVFKAFREGATDKQKSARSGSPDRYSLAAMFRQEMRSRATTI